MVIIVRYFSKVDEKIDSESNNIKNADLQIAEEIVFYSNLVTEF